MQARTPICGEFESISRARFFASHFLRSPISVTVDTVDRYLILMSHSKKPAILVAVVLSALIVLPVLVLMIFKSGGRLPEAVGGGATAVEQGHLADFELRQLAERAEELIDGSLADALRKGDLSLDFIAALKRDAERAATAMADGKQQRAKELYAEVIVSAEAQLESLKLAERARQLQQSTYAELDRLEDLQAAFAQTYSEAVTSYNQGLQALNAAQYQQSIDHFEMTGAILGDLEARALKQINALLESAAAALEGYKLDQSRAAYGKVLAIHPAHEQALEGLAAVQALEGIADQIKAVRDFESAGRLDEALAQIEILAAEHPQNTFVLNQRMSIQARIIDRDIGELVSRADAAEAKGDFQAAVDAVEAALALRAEPQLQQRLEGLEAKAKAARLEQLLETGYNALKLGQYREARDLYKSAVALAPESKEAATGYEKASGLYLANIRYSQNLASAERAIKDGRFPRAAEFFNAAMAARPQTIAAALEQKESELRVEIRFQTVEIPVFIKSDKKTFVSLIGVLPPQKFRSQDLKLFPDVYIIKGTRRGYKPVEIELRVDAHKKSHTIELVCTEKL